MICGNEAFIGNIYKNLGQLHADLLRGCKEMTEDGVWSHGSSKVIIVDFLDKFERVVHISVL